MKRILCYGDSNTWGHDPIHVDPVSGFTARYPVGVRWTSVIGNELGEEYTVLEEGYCGRTTIFEDPLANGRNGLMHLEVAFRTHDPVDCIIIMLGTNDTRDIFNASAECIALGMERLVCELRKLMENSLSHAAKILVVSPIHVRVADDGNFYYTFSESSVEKSKQLAPYYRQLAKRLSCGFMDAAAYAYAGGTDGIHLEEVGHAILGKAIAEKVNELLK
jgi:lysophospholipase L1-like esterase